MKKRIIALAMAVLVGSSTFAVPTVLADGADVVSIGADLTKEQRDKMFEYFGVSETGVAVIEVNNQDEREYLEGVATEQQIGRRTYSSAYIEETEEGSGINVKTANLTWVTSNMIKGTLTTAGIYDCNVVAAAPFAVSGTGALTGIMKAFEIVTGEPLDEEKKEIATEEIVVSGNLAEEIGPDETVGILTDVKNTIIGENIVAADKIEQVIIDASDKYEVTLTDEQVEMILGTMTKIANQEYDYERIKDTYDSIIDSSSEKLGIELEQAAQGFFERIVNFFRSIWDWFVNLFNGGTSSDNGILDQTDDSILGDDVIIDSTVEEETVEVPEATEEPTEEPMATQEPEVTAEPQVEEPTQAPTEAPAVEEEAGDDVEEVEPTQEPVEELEAEEEVEETTNN